VLEPLQHPPWLRLWLVSLEITRHDHSIIACSRNIYVWCCSSRTSRSLWITQSTQHHRRVCNNIPSFLQRTAPIARSLCEGWTPHDLHILVTAPCCCDRKSWAAYAQSFALWQQATIEFTCHDHSSRTLLLRSIVDIVSITRDYTPRSLYYCLFAPHICMVLFFTHIPFVVNHTINATPPESLQHWTRTEKFHILLISDGLLWSEAVVYGYGNLQSWSNPKLSSTPYPSQIRKYKNMDSDI